MIKVPERVICALSVVSGITLFTLAVIGLSDYPADPIRELTVLIQPSGVSAGFDNAFLVAMMVAGAGLTLAFKVRLVAGTALALVLSKIAILNGPILWIPLAFLGAAIAGIKIARCFAHYGRSVHSTNDAEAPHRDRARMSPWPVVDVD